MVATHGLSVVPPSLKAAVRLKLAPNASEVAGEIAVIFGARLETVTVVAAQAVRIALPARPFRRVDVQLLNIGVQQGLLRPVVRAEAEHHHVAGAEIANEHTGVSTGDVHE